MTLGRRGAVFAALGASVLALVTLPPAAGAARYVVEACADPGLRAFVARPTDGWIPDGLTPPGGAFCQSDRGLVAQSGSAFGGFRFDAPPATALTDAWTSYDAHLPGGAPWAVPVFVVEARYRDLWSYVPPAQGYIGGTPIDFGAPLVHADIGGAEALRYGVRCEIGPCAAADLPRMNVHALAVALNDPEPPALEPLAGSLVAAGAQQGVRELALAASDRGSGIAELTVTAGGLTVDAWSPGGRCARLAPTLADLPHYDAPVPCPPVAQRTVAVDTARLADGPQPLSVRVEDAAGNARTVSTEFVADNHPPGPGALTLSGAARVGERLAAAASGFDGQSPRLEFSWQRCSAAGDACEEVAGNGPSHLLTPGDAGHRLRARVVASDRGGSASALSALSDVVNAPADAAATPVPTPTATATPAATPVPTAAPGPVAAPAVPGPSAVQTVVVTRPDHVANGRRASEHAVLLAWLEGPHGRRGIALTAPAGTRVRIRGRLTDEAGRAIAGAAVSLVEYRGGWPRVASGATTRPDGRFTAFTRLGPGRTLRFSYRAFSDSSRLTRSPALHLRVARRR